MTRALTIVLLLLGLSSTVRADVVHLTTGRPIKGKVVKETKTHVVVKTANGKVTLPRRIVSKIVRESNEKTWLEEGRKLTRDGAFDRAQRLLEKAAKASDGKVAREAKQALKDLEAARAAAKPKRRTPTRRPRPTRPTPRRPSRGGPTTSPSGFEATIQAASVAIRKNEPKRALELLDGLGRIDGAPGEVQAYMQGRAHELNRDPGAAYKAYRSILRGVPLQATMKAAWLGDLARRKVAGETLTIKSAGVDRSWRREQTKNFAIYHKFPRVEPWFRTEPENALDHVLKTLEIRRSELGELGRILVFIYVDQEDYKAGTGASQNTAGHATRVYAPDGLVKIINAYPDSVFYKDTYRHEIAHAVLFDLYPDLPGWAHEGAAGQTESARRRDYRRRIFIGRKKEHFPLETLLVDRARYGDSLEKMRIYYAQAATTFSVLAKVQRSTRKALELCVELRKRGAKPALARVGLDLRRLERELESPPAIDLKR